MKNKKYMFRKIRKTERCKLRLMFTGCYKVVLAQ